jgi:3-deoxy-manno-octulosonate cytidylyltransferase (CMP-KDO synthetase)
MKIIAMIPARYEASRFPGKLLKDLAGKSVIMRTYDATVATGLFDEVYVVTDSELIYSEVLKYHGKVIMSQKTHETGSDRIAEAVEFIDTDIVINVQGDEPFVNGQILKKLIDAFQSDIENQIDVASLIFPLDHKEDIENPNHVKVVVDHNHFALYFSRSPIPYPRDASSATYYQHIGVYAFRKEALMRFTKLPMDPLEKTEKLENLRFLVNGMKVKMLITDYKSIGIDVPEDLDKAIKRFKSL